METASSNVSIKRIVFWLIVLALTGAILAYIVNYYRSFSMVSIDSKIPEKISVYQSSSTDTNNVSYDKNSQPITSFSGSKTIKLKKRQYVLVVEDTSNKYASDTTSVFPKASKLSVEINPDLSQKTLASMLTSQKDDIDQAIEQQVYNFNNSGFSIHNETLYKQGQWAGALLVPSSTSQNNFRVILNKDNNSWKVVTNPPQINIGSPKFPNIPFDVINSVDNFLKP